MVKKRTIVEINGRKYDANTGQIVSETPTATPVIDGFKAPIASSSVNSAPKLRTVNTANSIHQQPQKTKKLHPAAVKKTVVPNTVISKSSTLRKPAAADVQPAVVQNPQSTRQERATLQTKSEHIRRFQASVQEAPAPVEDQVEPEQVAAPIAPMPRAVPARPSNVVEQSQPEVQTEKKKPGFLKRATQRRPRLVPAAIMTVAVLAIGGYVAYQNIPNMALRLAAQRAGFNASLPGYSPSGFGFSGPVSYAEGVVELEYSSTSDDRSYSLVQKESSWDSQSLLDNFVTANSDDYLTFQERGLTVYIYDTSNATWVDGGIWYTVEGNSLLTSEQLLKIAGSL